MTDLIAIARLLFLNSDTLWFTSAGIALRIACGISTKRRAPV